MLALFLFLAFICSESVKNRIIFFSLPHFSHLIPVLQLAVDYSERYPETEIIFACSEKYRDIAEKHGLEYYSTFNNIDLDASVRRYFGNSTCYFLDIWGEVSKEVGKDIAVMNEKYPSDMWVFDFIAYPSEKFCIDHGIKFVKVENTAVHSGMLVFGVGDMFSPYLISELQNDFFLALKEVLKPLKMFWDCGSELMDFAMTDESPTIIQSFLGFEVQKRKYYPGYLKRVGFLPYIRSEEEGNVLSEEIKEFIEDDDDDDDGRKIVYCSPGSMFLFEEEMADLLIESLLDLDYRVIYSMRDSVRSQYSPEFFEKYAVSGNRVKFSPWLNQWKLLQHPKLDFFVSHAGGASVMEATYNNVPIFAIPQYGDQFGLSGRIVEKGMGERILLQKEEDDNENSSNKKKMKEELKKMKQNIPKYKKNMELMKELSMLQGGVSSGSKFIREIYLMGDSHLQKVGVDIQELIPLIFVVIVGCLIYFGSLFFLCFVYYCCSGRNETKKRKLKNYMKRQNKKESKKKKKKKTKTN